MTNIPKPAVCRLLFLSYFNFMFIYFRFSLVVQQTRDATPSMGTNSLVLFYSRREYRSVENCACKRRRHSVGMQPVPRRDNPAAYLTACAKMSYHYPFYRAIIPTGLLFDRYIHSFRFLFILLHSHKMLFRCKLLTILIVLCTICILTLNSIRFFLQARTLAANPT